MKTLLASKTLGNKWHTIIEYSKPLHLIASMIM